MVLCEIGLERIVCLSLGVSRIPGKALGEKAPRRMTASAFASLINAKRVSKGKWMGRCPSHPDSRPSLSVKEGKRGVLLTCWSAGCTTREICAALGIKVSDLFYDEVVSRQVRSRMSQHDLLANLRRQMDLVVMLGSLESGKREYWRVVYRRLSREWRQVRLSLEPEAVLAEDRERRLQKRIRKYGFERLWEEVYGNTR